MKIRTSSQKAASSLERLNSIGMLAYHYSPKGRISCPRSRHRAAVRDANMIRHGGRRHQTARIELLNSAFPAGGELAADHDKRTDYTPARLRTNSRRSASFRCAPTVILSGCQFPPWSKVHLTLPMTGTSASTRSISITKYGNA